MITEYPIASHEKFSVRLGLNSLLEKIYINRHTFIHIIIILYFQNNREIIVIFNYHLYNNYYL